MLEGVYPPPDPAGRLQTQAPDAQVIQSPQRGHAWRPTTYHYHLHHLPENKEQRMKTFEYEVEFSRM